MNKLACALALSGIFLSSNALAWGSDGHRAVGAIAARLIKGSHAEQQVAALLQPGESLESISTWADTAKGGVGYPTPSAEMAAYTAANPHHSEYHYTDVPFQHTHYEDGAVGTADVDIVHTLRQAIAVLQGRTDANANPHNFSKRQALLLLAHMTGDIHQPLHVGAAYIGKDGKYVIPRTHQEVDSLNVFDSCGGNNLLLDDERLTSLSRAVIPGEDKPLPEGAKKWTTRPLHTYWDTTVVDYAMRRTSTRTPEQFADKVIEGKPEVARASGDPITWPTQWADDALAASKLAFTGVTPGKISSQVSKKGETYYTFALEMNDNYPVPSSALARTQLIKGGYHLAQVLQAIWP
ncbi:MAG: S1/P1 nuclease [Gammaproteobacteria bacterium]